MHNSSWSIVIRVNIGKKRIEYYSNQREAENAGREPSGQVLLTNLKTVKNFDDISFQLDGNPNFP
jgi:hypothetical protein